MYQDHHMVAVLIDGTVIYTSNKEIPFLHSFILLLTPAFAEVMSDYAQNLASISVPMFS